MQIKPEPNQSDPPENSQSSSGIGGDSITISGNVGVGANIGRGSVRADNISGGDMIVQGANPEEQQRIGDLMTELQNLIQEARKSGEIDDNLAKEALETLESATEMISNPDKNVKKKVVGKLQYVADVLEAATDLFQGNGPASKLIKALPIVTLLIKVVPRLF